MKNLRKTSLFIFILLISFLLHASELQVKVIQNAEDLPEKFCTTWMKGDFFASNGKNLVIIGGSSRTLQSLLNYPAADALGNILSFVPAGKNLKSDLLIGAPYLRIKNKRKYIAYSSVKPIKEKTSEGSLIFEASASFESEKGATAQLFTTYLVSPQKDRIDITSTIKNTGKVELTELSYSLYFSANQQYNFSPFHREKHPELRFNVYPKEGHLLGWVNLNPLEDEEEEYQPGNLAPGESYKVKYILLVDTQYDRILDKIYKIFGVETELATILIKDFQGSLMELIVRDAFSSSVFFRSFLDKLFSVDVPLPKGAYRVRANFFPAVQDKLLLVEPEKENICTLQDPLKGKIKVKIQDSKGEYIPGKVTFIGLHPTTTPYFKPTDPIKSGRGWEYFKNSCHPPEEGQEVELPVGTYLVYSSRGPEYTMDQKVVEITSEVFKYEPRELIFQIDKIVETTGLISVDPHMHTQYSDGSVKISERIKSVVAEGVEVAVATDHNYINDYSPTLKKLGLDKYLFAISGDEVSTGDVIHFNTYPVTPRKEELNNGAINPFSEEAMPLFEAIRKQAPEAILQVNHPRSGRIGYFNNYQLERESAASARINFDTSFNVLEVMNGPYFYSSNYVTIKDWFHLLNRGYYFPGVGSSDAHGIDRGEPGYSRTYVFYRGQKASNLDKKALIQAIKMGHSFLSNGPIVEFKINDKFVPGDTFTAPEGKVNIWIKVQSAPWVSVDEVRLIVNGERKIVFPVYTDEKATIKFSDEISLNLKKDAYLVVEVLGKKSLFPVLQAASRTGLLENAVLPYALTNPIFVDTDGNGKFDPPLPKKIKLIAISEPKNIVQRY